MVELMPVELIGRGKRFGEGFYHTFDDAVCDIYNNVKDVIENQDYAIFGHSMGGILAYELYKKILSESSRKPVHIFFSGCDIFHPTTNIDCTLPDFEFFKEIYDLGGVPEDIFENKELIELMTPIIRSDFNIINKYNFFEQKKQLDCDISVLSGKHDSLNKYDNEKNWKLLTHKDSSFLCFDDGHFFINTYYKEMIKYINHKLVKYIIAK